MHAVVGPYTNIWQPEAEPKAFRCGRRQEVGATGRVGLHGPPEAWEQLSPPTSCLSSSSSQPPPAALSSISPAVSHLHGTALSPLVTMNVCPMRAPGVGAHD